MALISVLVASEDAQLTTTAAVKNRLGTTSTADDSYIDSLITRASAWAEEFVGYPLQARKYLELLPSYGSRRLMLKNTPIVAVPGLFRGSDSADYQQVDTTEYQLDTEAGFLERVGGWDWTVPTEVDLTLHPIPGQEFPVWRAEYVAGYHYTGLTTASDLWSTEHGTTSTERTLPQDIEQAVIEKVVRIVNGDEGVAEKQVGVLRIRYSSFGSGRITDPAALLLEPHRRF